MQNYAAACEGLDATVRTLTRGQPEWGLADFDHITPQQAEERVVTAQDALAAYRITAYTIHTKHYEMKIA